MKTRTNLSIHHITGAAYFAGQVKKLEQGVVWPPPDSVFFPHMANSIASVISSAAALEAYLNELRLDAADSSNVGVGVLWELGPKIARLWDTVERLSTIRKFDWLLTLADREQLDFGGRDQAVGDLFNLRDRLVHAKPEWSDDGSISTKMEHRLKGKFSLNQFSASDQAFFPYRCLGAGCSEWSVRTATRFVDRYTKLVGGTSAWSNQLTRLESLLEGNSV
jgi:hypothetical protein